MNSYTLLSCIESKVEHSTKFYGRFELGPFAPGQALTVANALRRSLLSQLSGSAITLLEIKDASNEYEILNGVRESVLDIILNLKQIVLTSDFEIFSPQVGFLNVKGPGIVRASDLKLPAFIYAVDPNQYIATLNTKGHLNMKFLICSGKNYITYTPNDENYFEWLNLFEKATPSTLHSLKILEKADSKIAKLNSSLAWKKPSLPLNLKKTLEFSFHNKNQEKFFAFPWRSKILTFVGSTVQSKLCLYDPKQESLTFSKGKKKVGNATGYDGKPQPRLPRTFTAKSRPFRQNLISLTLARSVQGLRLFRKNKKTKSSFFTFSTSVSLAPCTYGARPHTFSEVKSCRLEVCIDDANFLQKPKVKGASSNLASRVQNKNEKVKTTIQKLVPRETPIDFYKQWIKERVFLTKDFVFTNDLNHNHNFPKNKKLRLLDDDLGTKFEKQSTKKAILSAKFKFDYFEKTKGKNKITEPTKTDTFSPKVKNYKAGYFPIDALFMPVTRVNYLIESDENFKSAKDRIILEVWTNGSIHPRHAIHKAAKALIQLFLPLQQMRTTLFQKNAIEFDNARNRLAKTSSAIKKNKTFEKIIENSARHQLYNQGFDTRILDLDIGNLELKARSYSFLKKANINTIQDLISYSKKDLLTIKNFELNSLVEIEKALKFLNLELK